MPLEPPILSEPAPVKPLSEGRTKKPPVPKPDHCLNCGAAASGNFCADCGQEIKSHTVALGPLLSDLLSELISWDSKLLRTILPLLVRPGFLTNEYNAGRRVPYLSPLKLYLTVSVLFFLLLAWRNPLTDTVQIGAPAHQATHASFSFGGKSEPLPHTAAEYDATQARRKPAERDSPLEQLFVHHIIKAGGNKQGFIGEMLSDFPKMMFFLLPAFAVLLKLLYLRTKRLYVEHLIFLLHVHAFGFIILLLPTVYHPDWLVIAVSLALPVYVIAALRVVYQQGWIKTLVKFSLLGFGYVVLFSLCLAGTALTALWLF